VIEYKLLCCGKSGTLKKFRVTRQRHETGLLMEAFYHNFALFLRLPEGVAAIFRQLPV
jgi:hypothetical protein